MSDIFNTRREPRPCKRCGYVRTVKITDDRKFVPDGKFEISHGVRQATGSFQVVGELHERHCGACKAELRAIHYANLAEDWQQRGRMLRAKQDAKGGGK